MNQRTSNVIRPIEIPTILEVPHNNGVVQFAARRWEVFWDAFQVGCWEGLRTNNYGYLAHSIMSDDDILTYEQNGNLKEGEVRTPKPDESISLVSAAKFSEESYEFNLLRRCKRHFIYNINFWTPRGVYMVYDDWGTGGGKNDIHNGSVIYPEWYTKYQIDSLQKWIEQDNPIEVKGVLFARSKDIAFVPKKTFKTKGHTIDSIAKDGFVIGLSRGEEGAQKLAELFANNGKEKNYLRFPRGAKSRTNLVTVCALEGDYDNRYLVCNKNAESIGEGYSLGIIYS